MSDVQNQTFSQQGLSDQNSLWHSIRFMIRQVLGLTRIATPVKIVAVHGGGVGPPPTVDVTPLVNQIDGAQVKTEHTTVYGIQTTRTMSGNGAIISDPVAGDIGWMSVGDRDHSTVMSQGDRASPASLRRHSLSDGVYVAGINPKSTPTQYVIFHTDGVEVHDSAGNYVRTYTSGSNSIVCRPVDTSHFVILGGDPSKDGGVYDFVETVGGPSINVKARTG